MSIVDFLRRKTLCLIVDRCLVSTAMGPVNRADVGIDSGIVVVAVAFVAIGSAFVAD